MFLIAGVAAFLFGLSQLKLFELRLPAYSGTPKFIQNRGDYSKSFFMGLLLGNAGVGCPNPMFYWLLIYVASTGSAEVGASLGLVHGVGRAIPLILLSVLAVIGINATKGITSSRENIEKITGWMLIVIGAFLIIQGIPGGHEWYESTFVHIGWNNIVSMTPIPPEFHMGEHIHENDAELPQELAPILFVGMIVFPIIWYFTQKKETKT
jgi:cytochrome c-type biogenesis protein